jgi:hypothetical protein
MLTPFKAVLPKLLKVAMSLVMKMNIWPETGTLKGALFTQVASSLEPPGLESVVIKHQ